jgi:hypothetical protein
MKRLAFSLKWHWQLAPAAFALSALLLYAALPALGLMWPKLILAHGNGSFERAVADDPSAASPVADDEDVTATCLMPPFANTADAQIYQFDSDVTADTTSLSFDAALVRWAHVPLSMPAATRLPPLCLAPRVQFLALLDPPPRFVRPIPA